MSDALDEALRALQAARSAAGTPDEAEADERAFTALAAAVVAIGGDVAHRVLMRAREAPWPEELAGASDDLDADRKALARFLYAFRGMFPNSGDIAARAVDDLIGFSQGQRANLLFGAPVGRGRKPFMRRAQAARTQIVLAIVYGAALAEATDTAFADDVLTPDEDGRTPFAQWSEEVPAEEKALARDLGRRARDRDRDFEAAEWARIEHWEALLDLQEADLRAMADGTTDLNAHFAAVREDSPI